MKTINKVFKSFKSKSHNINEIIEFNNNKFKLTASIYNGGRNMDVRKMNSDGIFEYVLGEDDLDFTYTHNYVSYEHEVKEDLEKAITAMKNLVKKVYK